MPIRITGGRFKGRIIPTQKGRTRPTAAVVRQALFNIIGDISNAKFCDLYAGSAAVGIEAASRGAGYIEFVESNARTTKIIENTIAGFDLPRYCVARVRRLDVKKWVEISTDSFDIIFADPPYLEKPVIELMSLIPKIIAKLKPDGLFALQIGKRFPVPDGFSDSHHFGDDILYFWRKG